MGLWTKLKIEHTGLFFFASFYLIVSAINFAILGIYGLGLFHVALVAGSSFVAAIGIYRLRSWSLWFVVGIFFIATTYATLSLNTAIESYARDPNLNSLSSMLVWVTYLLLTWIATIYVSIKRKILR